MNVFAVLHETFEVLMRIQIPEIIVQILKRSLGEHPICIVTTATYFLRLSNNINGVLENFSIYASAEWSLALL